MSKVTEGQIDELKAKAGRNEITREMLQAFLDNARRETEQRMFVSLLLERMRHAGYELIPCVGGSGDAPFIWASIAVASRELRDFYQFQLVCEKHCAFDHGEFASGEVRFRVARKEYDLARQALKSLQSIFGDTYDRVPKSAVLIACATQEEADFKAAESCLHGFSRWLNSDMVVAFYLDMGIRGERPNYLESLAERNTHLSEYQRYQLADGFRRLGYFVPARREANKIIMGSAMHLKSDAFVRIGFDSGDPSDLVNARKAAWAETYENKQAKAFANIYRLSNDQSDLAAAREAATHEHDALSRTAAWAEIAAITKAPGDFVQAETALPPRTARGSLHDWTLELLATCYAKAGNFVPAFRIVREFPKDAQYQISNTLIAISQSYAAEEKLKAAAKTIERIGPPYWRAQGFLALHADIAQD